MKIDFTKFPLYVSCSKDFLEAFNITESLSNIIYTNIAGIGAHLLSEKIYLSKGEIEINDVEIKIIQECYPLLTGAFADSLNDYIEKNKGKKEVINEN